MRRGDIGEMPMLPACNKYVMEDVMSTETRIGIVAGLLIVFIASVSFFYGSSHRDDDVLIAATPKPAALKIPISNEKPPAAVKPGPLVQNTPRNPAIRPQQEIGRASCR